MGVTDRFAEIEDVKIDMYDSDDENKELKKPTQIEMKTMSSNLGYYELEEKYFHYRNTS
jgi:hypothetical protein